MPRWRDGGCGGRAHGARAPSTHRTAAPLGTVEPHRAHGRVRAGLALRRPSDSGAPARNADGACGHRHARREHLGAEHRPRPRANRPKDPPECGATLSDRMAAGGETTDQANHTGMLPSRFANPQVRASRRGGTLANSRQGNVAGPPPGDQRVPHRVLVTGRERQHIYGCPFVVVAAPAGASTREPTGIRVCAAR